MREQLALAGVGSAPELQERFTEALVRRSFSPGRAAEIIAYAAAAEFARRITFRELNQYGPKPKFWDEMIAWCADQGHIVQTGARPAEAMTDRTPVALATSAPAAPRI